LPLRSKRSGPTPGVSVDDASPRKAYRSERLSQDYLGFEWWKVSVLQHVLAPKGSFSPCRIDLDETWNRSSTARAWQPKDHRPRLQHCIRQIDISSAGRFRAMALNNRNRNLRILCPSLYPFGILSSDQGLDPSTSHVHPRRNARGGPELVGVDISSVGDPFDAVFSGSLL
jgi:hypothetical protein